ncbi:MULTISPECIES: PAS domain-containing sensor histidine kinase [unclassified Beijerinckia]|uniref:PAS domain-containing sensor histidine kinase n=1 Tax=unclassified Beijerinckia TaxID=2638183 RepID=UPI000895AE55|nr:MULTISPECIES: PAS domain-containing sensor histidine kinase [unclassified Beijerinckia]MDH7799873.1 PAS domain S-box-containing protein [Beijerinckia sp. GAS462]SED40628.1 PAS domain S-box-containing protein [Beijerinckia sp. 28-YEA-48]
MRLHELRRNAQERLRLAPDSAQAATVHLGLEAKGRDRPPISLSPFIAGEPTEDHYRTAFEQSPVTLFLLQQDSDGRCRFQSVSTNCDLIIGITRSQILGKTLSDLLQPADALFLQNMHDRCLEQNVTLRAERQFGFQSGLTHCEIQISPLSVKGETAKATVGSLRNITRQQQTLTNLKTVTGQLLERQDQERRQIARDLHDSAAQTLWGASMEIARASKIMPMKRAAREALTKALEYISQTQEELRTVSYLLHPPLLEEAGLSLAIPWFLDGFSVRTGLSTSVTIAEPLRDGRLPLMIETALFRVLQESLANVHRHAQAKTATVNLLLENETIQLVVLDDGLRGRSLSKLKQEVREGVGIGGMRGRIRTLGGTLTVQFTDHGTLVLAAIPFPDKTDLAQTDGVRFEGAMTRRDKMARLERED